MSTARLAIIASLLCLTACAPAAQESTPAPTLPTGPLPVAPTLTALAPGSPLAQVPSATPTPTPTPSPTATATSPLLKSVLGWKAYRTSDAQGVAVVQYSKTITRDDIITAGVYPSTKTQAGIEVAMPEGKRYGTVWCAPTPNNAKAFSCVLKAGADSAVLAVGTDGVPVSELAKVTEALVNGL